MKKVDLDNYEKPTRFIKFKVGDNPVRILSDIYLYRKLGIRAGGRYVPHILRDGQPIPDLFKGHTENPKLQYGAIVLDRATEDIKILEVGPILGDQIAQMLKAKSGEYKKHDLVVSRKGEGLRDTTYKVRWAEQDVPLPKGLSKDSAEYQYQLKYFEEASDAGADEASE